MMPRRNGAWALLPSVGPGLEGRGIDQDSEIVLFSPSKESFPSKKFRLVALGQAGQLILADAKTNK